MDRLNSVVVLEHAKDIAEVYVILKQVRNHYYESQNDEAGDRVDDIICRYFIES